MKPNVSDWKIRIFRLRTAMVVMFAVAIGVVLESVTGGIGGIVVGILILRYLDQRDREMVQLKWQHYLGEEGKIRQSAEAAINNGKRVLLDGMIQDAYYFGLSNKPVLCRTCQTAYRYDTIPKLCWNLRDEFPHDPKADPPKLNPFRWWWFTNNGYPMPPVWHPDTEPWMPMSAVEDNPNEVMTAEGRLYYERNPNPLWEAGFGKTPNWYKVRGQQAA